MITLITTPANNIPYLFAAFAIAWVVFFGYVFFTSRRQQELEREVRGLQEELKRRGASRDQGGPG